MNVGDSKTGLATGVLLSNKFASIPCDAVVFCTGAQTPSVLKSMLGLTVPLMPHKGY